MAFSTFRIFILLFCFPLIVTSSPLLSLPLDGTACDWNVWDDTAEEKSIQKISLRCSEGQVTWRTPYGGLALDFLPLLKSQPFELCFVARSSFATVQLFLEGNRTLTRLAALSGSKSSQTREICLRSDGDKPLVIFLETDSSSSSPVYGKVVFEYDIQVIPQEHVSKMQDCHPCSAEEIVMAVCTADYAIFGEIHSVARSKESGMTELNVNATRIIRQRYKVVKDLLDVHNLNVKQPLVKRLHEDHFSLKASDRYSSMKNKSRLPDFLSALDAAKEARYHLSIGVPAECQIKRGNGIFLFLGSIRLKRARLGCAPRVEEFKQIWSNALATGRNPCVL